MKICLLFEFYNSMGGTIRKILGKNGVITSYENQKKILEKLNIDYTTHWDKSCDILQINYPGLTTFQTIKKARKEGQKIILWAHTTAEDFRNSFFLSNLLSPVLKKFLAYYLDLADIIFCPSQHGKNRIVSYGIPEKKIVVMSNGVDTRFFKPNKKKREEGRKKFSMQGVSVGTLGIVIKRKGIDIFLRLAKKYPKNNFYWFGKIFSQFLARSLPPKTPQNAKFTGQIASEETSLALNALDIFLFPSLEENQGIAILEAASAGLAILCRDLPAYNGWLVHGENCLKARNNKEFEKYLNLLIKNKGLRKRLGENALKMAKKEDIANVAKRVKKVYDSLLQES